MYGRVLSRETGDTAAAASALRTLAPEPTSADDAELASRVHRKWDEVATDEQRAVLSSTVLAGFVQERREPREDVVRSVVALGAGTVHNP